MKRLTLAVIWLSAAGAALGLATFSKPFNDLYKPAAGSALAKAKCAACHTKMPATKDLNPYGKDMAAALKKAKTKTLTTEILKGLEGLDSDKDKVSNGEELKKGTLPGDPKSK